MKYAYLFLTILLLMPVKSNADDSIRKFAIYYSDKARLESFNDFQLLVLDSIHHPPLKPLKEKGKLLLGYISLGEIETHYPYYQKLKSNGLLLAENKNWKGSRVVDLRQRMWQEMVIEDIVPKILNEGFDGIFIDTLDSPIEMERVAPEKFGGMKQMAVNLVRGIRMHYPSIKIMVNRGYPILPELAPYIDMALGESVYSDYNFDTKKYGKVEESLYKEQVDWLNKGRKANPQLAIFTLDYAEKNDHRTMADIYRVERQNNFIPYVTTVGLDEVTDEEK